MWDINGRPYSCTLSFQPRSARRENHEDHEEKKRGPVSTCNTAMLLPDPRFCEVREEKCRRGRLTLLPVPCTLAFIAAGDGVNQL